MLATVLVEHPDHVIGHYVNDTPTATVEGDFLTDLASGRCVFLSHESIIPQTPLTARPVFVYYDFYFLTFSLLCA